MVELKVAALFVEVGGSYYDVPGVEPWDEWRDARRYDGQYPVVAHPPCQRWTQIGAAAFARWGGEHNRPGNDGGCFASALLALRRCGGVLEHPAKSSAFEHFGIMAPTGSGWQRIGEQEWICEVWQSAYGHRANKATWLLYHGERPPFELRWSRPTGSHQVGFRDSRGAASNKPTVGKREAIQTPLEFRDELIALARHSRKPGVIAGIRRAIKWIL